MEETMKQMLSEFMKRMDEKYEADRKRNDEKEEANRKRNDEKEEANRKRNNEQVKALIKKMDERDEANMKRMDEIMEEIKNSIRVRCNNIKAKEISEGIETRSEDNKLTSKEERDDSEKNMKGEINESEDDAKRDEVMVEVNMKGFETETGDDELTTEEEQEGSDKNVLLVSGTDSSESDRRIGCGDKGEEMQLMTREKAKKRKKDRAEKKKKKKTKVIKHGEDERDRPREDGQEFTRVKRFKVVRVDDGSECISSDGKKFVVYGKAGAFRWKRLRAWLTRNRLRRRTSDWDQDWTRCHRRSGLQRDKCFNCRSGAYASGSANSSAKESATVNRHWNRRSSRDDNDDPVTWSRTRIRNSKNRIKLIMTYRSWRSREKRDLQSYETSRRLRKQLDRSRRGNEGNWKKRTIRSRQRILRVHGPGPPG